MSRCDLARDQRDIHGFSLGLVPPTACVRIPVSADVVDEFCRAEYRKSLRYSLGCGGLAYADGFRKELIVILTGGGVDGQAAAGRATSGGSLAVHDLDFLAGGGVNKLGIDCVPVLLNQSAQGIVR